MGPRTCPLLDVWYWEIFKKIITKIVVFECRDALWLTGANNVWSRDVFFWGGGGWIETCAINTYKYIWCTIVHLYTWPSPPPPYTFLNVCPFSNLNTSGQPDQLVSCTSSVAYINTVMLKKPISVNDKLDTTGCGRKKWTPKFFRCFLSNRLGF